MAVDDRTAGGQQDSPAVATTGSSPGSFPALIGLARRSVVLAGLIGVASLVATGFALMQLRDYHVQTAVRTLQHVAYGLSEVTSRQIVEADRNIVRILEAARLQPELLADREQRDRVIPRNLSSIGQASAIAFI